MKKQGELYLKIISIVLAAVVLAYVLFSVIFKAGSGYALTAAVRCEVGDGMTVSGFVVRDEKVLTADGSVVVCELSDGARIAAGQTVATVYRTAEERTRRQELTRLNARLAQLEYTADNLGTRDDAALDLQIKELLVQSAQQAQAGELSAARQTAERAQPMVLRRSVTDDDGTRINLRISELKSRIEELSAATSLGQGTLTPEAVQEMTVAQLRVLENQASAAPAQAIGRLALGQKWYFLAEVPSERLAGHYEGDRLKASFAGENLQDVSMTIERIGDDENGSRVLLLSCERLMQEVVSLRRVTADIVFKTYSGLSIEPQALYYVDGSAGVYVREGVRARFKKVNILYEYDGGYVVELDTSSTSNLWPEDEIILTSDDIYAGKVFE